MSNLPAADQVEGALHPRLTTHLVGQQLAEAAFLEAFNTGRLHHGWLITGPRGVGKATLSWRIARFLLATPIVEEGGLFDTPPPRLDSLDIAADHPVMARIDALSESRLFLLRRPWDHDRNRFKREITVDEVRRLKDFLQLSAADGGRRVVIVDSADEMNSNAANALLKLLEEPPENTVLLLISHQPSRLLPTIRSRCRELRCKTLSAPEMEQALSGTETVEDAGALAELAGGSVGEAVRYLNLDGLTTYAAIVGLMSTLPRLDRPRALALAESVAGTGNEEKLDLLLGLMDRFLARTARTGAIGKYPVNAARDEAEIQTRLCPDARAAREWATMQQELGARARHGRAVNLDPSVLILDMVFRIRDLATRTAS